MTVGTETEAEVNPFRFNTLSLSSRVPSASESYSLVECTQKRRRATGPSDTLAKYEGILYTKRRVYKAAKLFPKEEIQLSKSLLENFYYDR